MFSVDKLLGGPQAGIIAGRHALLTHIRRHPLMRALRADKMTYAALEATLQEYAAGRPPRTVPVARMLALTEADIEARAARIVEDCRRKGSSRSLSFLARRPIGGGSAPGSSLPTRLLAVSHQRSRPMELEARLRAWDPPIVARIEHDRLVLDLRTVLPEQDTSF